MNETWWVKPEQLDEGQQAVIDLPLDESHLIIGPPGSGKTNLLLLRGSQLVRSGKPNVLVLTFTRTLREFIITGSHQYAFGEDKVKTLNRWHYDFLREHGLVPEMDSDFATQRKKRIKQIQSVVDHKQLGRQYDAIILDESQDYLADEMKVFFALGNVVFAAADFRQHIYAVEKAPSSDLVKYFSNVYKLKYHYRNGQKICLLADTLAESWTVFESLVPTCMYNERRFPSSVYVKACADINDQLLAAVENVDSQIKAYPDELIGILCSTQKSLATVSSLISKTKIFHRTVVQSAADGYVAFEADKPVCICTIHGAKGLEFRAVHILDSENIKNSALTRHIAYTGITRAKTSLSFYHTAGLPGYLDSALAVFNGPVKQATLSDLFGGKTNAK